MPPPMTALAVLLQAHLLQNTSMMICHDGEELLVLLMQSTEDAEGLF